MHQPSMRGVAVADGRWARHYHRRALSALCCLACHRDALLCFFWPRPQGMVRSGDPQYTLAMATSLTTIGARSLGRAARLALQARKNVVTHSTFPVRATAMAGPAQLPSGSSIHTPFGTGSLCLSCALILQRNPLCDAQACLPTFIGWWHAPEPFRASRQLIVPLLSAACRISHQQALCSAATRVELCATSSHLFHPIFLCRRSRSS